MSTVAAWVASTSEDVSLLTHEYLPEFLVVMLFVLLVWTTRRFFARDHHRASH